MTAGIRPALQDVGGNHAGLEFCHRDHLLQQKAGGGGFDLGQIGGAATLLTARGNAEAAR